MSCCETQPNVTPHSKGTQISICTDCGSVSSGGRLLFGWSVCTNHRFGWHDNFAQTVVSNGTNDILSLVQFCGRRSSIVESCLVIDTGILVGLPHMIVCFCCFGWIWWLWLLLSVVVPRRSNADTSTNSGGRWTVLRGTRDPFFLVVSSKQLNRQVCFQSVRHELVP